MAVNSAALAPLTAIPPFPNVASRLLRLISREDADLKQIANLIGADVPLAARIVQQANSPLYARRYPANSVLQAVQVLGLHRVKLLSMTVLTRTYLGSKASRFELLACWNHSLACAILSEDLSEYWGLPADSCYLAGLMHDLGRLALAVTYHSEYADFLRATTSSIDPLIQEKEWFGLDHTEAGRHLALEWGLPEEIALVAGRHHDRPDGYKPDTLMVVQTACRLASAFGFTATSRGVDLEEALTIFRANAYQRLPEVIEAWRKQVTERVDSYS